MTVALKTISYIMVNVTDMSRAVAFYRDRLGIPLRFESPGWTEFETGATTLALHGGAVAHEPTRSPGHTGPKAAGTTTFGFTVDDVQKTYESLTERGVKFSLPPTERKEERIKLAIAKDPDGTEISFAQLLK
jgi:lactoylglutathione lyase